MTQRPTDLKVFISGRISTCVECKEELGRNAWIFLAGDKGALCLTCADLDHLVFVPSGDAALTRRSRKYSSLDVVVLKWSKARKRYERRGVLVEEQALEKAERECLSDAEARAQRRERQAERRAEIDREYVKHFASRVREMFPNAPKGRVKVIAEHACRKYSGRVGRTAAAKSFDQRPVLLAVEAHVRHAETDYDHLLCSGVDRWEARQRVAPAVDEVLRAWAIDGLLT